LASTSKLPVNDVRYSIYTKSAPFPKTTKAFDTFCNYLLKVVDHMISLYTSMENRYEFDVKWYNMYRNV